MRNKELKEKVNERCFDEIEEVEKRLNDIMIEYRTGKKQMKQAQS